MKVSRGPPGTVRYRKLTGTGPVKVWPSTVKDRPMVGLLGLSACIVSSGEVIGVGA
jgi:hypothetical protein